MASIAFSQCSSLVDEFLRLRSEHASLFQLHRYVCAIEICPSDLSSRNQPTEEFDAGPPRSPPRHADRPPSILLKALDLLSPRLLDTLRLPQSRYHRRRKTCLLVLNDLGVLRGGREEWAACRRPTGSYASPGEETTPPTNGPKLVARGNLVLILRVVYAVPVTLVKSAFRANRRKDRYDAMQLGKYFYEVNHGKTVHWVETMFEMHRDPYGLLVPGS
jgi:hypothetical protein